MPLTVGTAGHIDHGKTWLVRALTGKDTDRLPEEKARGISIDLGYAPLELPDGRSLSLVDVPGHERFVHTMIAGATGIDLFLLVIDAAEGARPQTLEHLAIIRLLGIDHGVVAVTKADAVDEETLELALEEARELVPGRRSGRGQREDRRRARRAARRAGRSRRPGRRRARGPADPAARRPRLHAARHRHGRDRNALVGHDRRGRRAARGARRPPGSRPQRPGARPAGRARTRRPARGGQPSRRRARAAPPRPGAGRARRVPGRATGSTSRSRSSSRSGATPACTSTTARPRSLPSSTGSATVTRSSASPRPPWPRAATESSCAPRRRSAAAPCSTPRRRGTRARIVSS